MHHKGPLVAWLCK